MSCEGLSKKQEQPVTAVDGKSKEKNVRGILTMTRVIPMPKTAMISEI